MPPRDDHYEILGVAPGADGMAIRAAYRALIRRYHPDVNASDDAAGQAAAINEAYRCLRDRDRRAAYDWERNARARRPRSGHASAHPSGTASARPAPPRPVWAGPTAPIERSAPWYQPSWGKAVGLGVAAVITGITFTITSAVPPVAKGVPDVRMRGGRTGAVRSGCANARASVGQVSASDCRS